MSRYSTIPSPKGYEYVADPETILTADMKCFGVGFSAVWRQMPKRLIGHKCGQHPGILVARPILHADNGSGTGLCGIAGIFARDGELVTCIECLREIPTGITGYAIPREVLQLTTLGEAMEEIGRLRRVNHELKDDKVALFSNIFLERLVKKNFVQFREAKLTLTGTRTGPDVKDLYIATYLAKLLRAAEAFGWERMTAIFKGGHWHFRGGIHISTLELIEAHFGETPEALLRSAANLESVAEGLRDEAIKLRKEKRKKK